MKISFINIFYCIIVSNIYYSQLKINEASNSNSSVIVIGENSPNWIELYNVGNTPLKMHDFYMSDSKNNLNKWRFPNRTLNPFSYFVVLATGKNDINTSVIDHYETVVFSEGMWKYTIPSSNIDFWNQLNFDDSNWSDGQGGFGFGDNDDQTIIPQNATSLYIRKTFNISDTSKIKDIILDIDYDDGFVAYLNGQEIARSGLSSNPTQWDELAVSHEATLYQGQGLSRYDISLTPNLLKNGNNILAIEVHNMSTSSTDLTLIPYLSFGFTDNDTYFGGNVHQYFQSNLSNYIETNFKINSSGEKLYLSDTNLTIIDSINVPDLYADMSFGRKFDGDTSQVYFVTATPGATNNTKYYYSYENEPSISIIGGVKYGLFNVEIVNNTASNGKIYYTLDGQTPTQSSFLYTQNIQISSTTVLKAKCFSSDTLILPSKTVSETYIFVQNHVLPILSLTVDNQDLYGPTGIFDNYNTDWKRACHIDYFDENGQKQFASFASVKPDGGAGGSRSNPQHSVTIEPANSSFGDGKPIEYPLIPEKGNIKKYYAFYLRNGSNFWNQYPQRDATFMRIMRNTNTNSQAYRPVVVYLNGNYFGVYEIREKANEYYFQENYGNNPDSLDLLSISYFYAPSIIRTVKGSDTSFYSMRDFIVNSDKNSNSFYNNVHSKLDLKNFTDYLIGENWFANYDWIYNNMKMARTRSTDNRWKFFLQDMELGLGSWGNESSDMFDYLINSNLPNPFNEIYINLIQNNTFKTNFINRYADLMNTIFTYNHYYPIVESMYQELYPEMPKQFELWTGDINGGMQTYLNNRNLLFDQFQQRSPIVRNQIIQYFNLSKQVNITLDVNPPNAGYIKISTIVPDSLPWNGIYFDGNPVEISAVANPGYSFVNWDVNGIISQENLNNPYLDLNVFQNSLFKANFIGHVDSAKIIVSEINYHPDSSLNGGNWIELYNDNDYDIQLDSWKIKSKKFYDIYEFPVKTTIKSKSFLVVCEDTNLFKLIYPDVANFIGSSEFSWDNDFDTVFVVNTKEEIIIRTQYTDSLPFPECADGWGRTLERTDLENPTSENEVKWYCSCIGGSPGAPPYECNDKLIFTEINHYNVENPHNSEDWVEIKNNSNETINLLNYQFKDNKDKHIYYFPSYEIKSGEYVVLSNNIDKFSKVNPNVNNVISNFDFSLSSKNDVLRLYDSSKKIIQSVIYKTQSPWPSKSISGNYTMEYHENLLLNPNDPDAWFDGCFLGSPGRKYSPCVFLPDGELVSIYPNPIFDEFIVVYDNPEFNYKDINLQIYDYSGRKLYDKIFNSDLEKPGFSINSNFLSCGSYLVYITNGEKKITKKIIKL